MDEGENASDYTYKDTLDLVLSAATECRMKYLEYVGHLFCEQTKLSIEHECEAILKKYNAIIKKITGGWYLEVIIEPVYAHSRYTCYMHAKNVFGDSMRLDVFITNAMSGSLFQQKFTIHGLH